MDPNTGELWTEEQISELANTSEASAQELRNRLVRIEGTDEAISELQTRVRQGALAEKLAKEILSVRPKMSIPKSKRHRG